MALVILMHDKVGKIAATGEVGDRAGDAHNATGIPSYYDDVGVVASVEPSKIVGRTPRRQRRGDEDVLKLGGG